MVEATDDNGGVREAHYAIYKGTEFTRHGRNLRLKRLRHHSQGVLHVRQWPGRAVGLPLVLSWGLMTLYDI
jgi:hypothetical protein